MQSLHQKLLDHDKAKRTIVVDRTAEVPNATDHDDDIAEAIYDAVCDGEGRATPYYLRHHLAKRGLVIVEISKAGASA